MNYRSGVQPVNIASAEFLRQLDAIERGVRATPCSITLLDGRSFNCALVLENPWYSDAGGWINPSLVRSVSESPFRMPARFANIIRGAGESGMGYHRYVVYLSDGKSFIHVSPNFTIDVVRMPAGYTPIEIVSVGPTEGRPKSKGEASGRSGGGLVDATVEFARQ